MTITSYKSYSISCRLCNFPSNNHSLPHQTSSPWQRTATGISKYSALDHHRRYLSTIFISNNGVKTRVLPSSPGIVDATATATLTKPVDISVFIQTSALLLFMYILANFVVPQIIAGKFNQEEEDN